MKNWSVIHERMTAGASRSFVLFIETITIEIASPSITFLERKGVDIFLFVLHQVFQRSPYESRVFGDIPAKEIGD
ncbi:hypothetical protein B6A27_16945 [Anoxybacillus sp. UARK-01]|uniref:hypothetical protein n=1 Tax=Anoxybacillus sp. UARK-01 TaxID=1895648 RepID=UPI0009BB403D|nr:hypothetical protein [Anoxybacillus sp. UARK-01]OQM44418.1 hypothetical protein B6A27_16945 [Anoxybacillus sp. UARK-01]